MRKRRIKKILLRMKRCTRFILEKQKNKGDIESPWCLKCRGIMPLHNSNGRVYHECPHCSDERQMFLSEVLIKISYA